MKNKSVDCKSACAATSSLYDCMESISVFCVRRFLELPDDDDELLNFLFNLNCI